MGYYDRDTGMYEVYPQEVATMRKWLAERGGLKVWDCHDLSDPGKTWTTPAIGPDGQPTGKPHWAAGDVIATITDQDKVIVTVPREVKRFHVAVRLGANGLKVKLADASSRRVKAACEKAGPDSWYEFDHSVQDALIFVPDRKVSIKDWKEPEPEPKSEAAK